MFCPYCQKDFEPRRSEQKFCSRACGTSYNNKKLRSGQNNAHWKPVKRAKDQDPIKRRARHLVEQAIKKGDLLRLPCHVCGLEKSEAHHSDYREPMKIEWLCRIHHRQADYRDKTKAGDFGH